MPTAWVVVFAQSAQMGHNIWGFEEGGMGGTIFHLAPFLVRLVFCCQFTGGHYRLLCTQILFVLLCKLI